MYRYRFVIYGVFGLMLLLVAGLFWGLVSGDDAYIDQEKKQRKLNGVFSVDSNYVYASIPSGGFYKLDGVAPKDFRVLDDKFADHHIGYTNTQVYAGNMVLPNMQAHNLTVLGNNYYTDGKFTYYVNRMSTSMELGALHYAVALCGYNFGWTNKPQSYWYPFELLPVGATYRAALSDNIAISQDLVCYKGRTMLDADPRNITSIFLKEKDRFDRPSYHYYTDKTYVYYQDQKIDLAYDDALYILDIEGDIPSRNEYLLAPSSGNIAVDGHVFDTDDGPYQVLATDLKHAYHVLVMGQKNIYYYDTQQEKIKKANKNVFKNTPLKPLVYDVFSANNEVYYLSGWEEWGRKYGLQSRHTALLKLSGISADGMKMLGTVGSNLGTVYQHESRYFYLDRQGSSQLIGAPIYEVTSKDVVQQLLSDAGVNRETIVFLIENGSLFLPESDEIFDVATSFPSDHDIVLWIVLVAVGIGGIIMFALRNKTFAPFFRKDEFIIVQNILFPKYRISDLAYVYFRVDKVNNRQTARMKFYKKDGTSSRTYSFIPKLSIKGMTATELYAYIHELKLELEKYPLAVKIN